MEVFVASWRDGKVVCEEFTFDDPIRCRRFCEEEILWESTLRVVCHEINFDERGTFARAGQGIYY